MSTTPIGPSQPPDAEKARRSANAALKRLHAKAAQCGAIPAGDVLISVNDLLWVLGTVMHLQSAVALLKNQRAADAELISAVMNDLEPKA